MTTVAARKEDWVAARSQFCGTQLGRLGSYPPSGKVLSATTLAIYRLEGGRIAEAWVEWDNLYGLRQLGYHKPI
jgi:predicted ester cyclase